MSTSREESPDWLRSFKAPSPVSLSSDSEPPSNDSDEDGVSLGKLFSKDKSNTVETKNNLDGNDSLVYTPSKKKSPAKKARVEHTPGGKRKRESQPENQGKDAKRKATEKLISHEEPKHSVWSLSSDPMSCPDTSPVRKGHILDKDLIAHNEAQEMKSEGTKDPDFLDSDGEPVPTEDLKMKSPKKQSEKDNHTPKKRKKVEKTTNEDAENKANADVLEEDIPEKHNGTHVSYSRLPLLLPEKVQRLKALVECDGDSIDLSGDVGAVGRVVISDNPSGSNEMLLDLKGTIYKTTIVPSRTFCVVSFGQSEAKIEAIMNDFIHLTPQSNVYEAETMVEGTLDGFSFDSEEEADNLPKKTAEGNQNEAIEDETNGKTERKAKKSLGGEQKKGKTGGGKQPKKAKKKPQVTKKNKKK
ncbi:PREDICTED: DNA-binding protein BIN4-like isoform X2 [Ipomoea nil]|uniref:DNA-binding protein BIN4-like isoform X2 n=1 Tax=Ipomoea nil TaxID=35883 RepID=UPI0009008B1F|nr:PREDICTED: DNA-binding protein BIN4-like isoform X2 [Ipomoea nil]